MFRGSHARPQKLCRLLRWSTGRHLRRMLQRCRKTIRHIMLKRLRVRIEIGTDRNVPLFGLRRQRSRRIHKQTPRQPLPLHLHLHHQDLRRQVQSHRGTPLLISEFVKKCLYLVFDAALFYAKSRDHKEQVNQILSSREINNLITIIKKYKDKAGVADILAYIEEKLRNQRLWKKWYCIISMCVINQKR